MAKKKNVDYKLYILQCLNCNGTGYISFATKHMVAQIIPCDFKPCKRGSIEVLAKSNKQANELYYAIYDKWKHNDSYDPDKNIFKDWVKHI